MIHSLTLIVVTSIAVAILLFLLYCFNSLIGLRNGMRSAWSDIDVQLTRRHDLVPNLVESVKGYMIHERATLEAVNQARSRAVRAGDDVATRAAAEMALTNAVGHLLAVAEMYPSLKASENFLLLQEQLNSTENRIAFARQHYNELVRRLNTAIAEFPRNLLAGALGFSPAHLFRADAAERVSVQAKAQSGR